MRVVLSRVVNHGAMQHRGTIAEMVQDWRFYSNESDVRSADWRLMRKVFRRLYDDEQNLDEKRRIVEATVQAIGRELKYDSQAIQIATATGLDDMMNDSLRLFFDEAQMEQLKEEQNPQPSPAKQ